jgi:hypothetical protein
MSLISAFLKQIDLLMASDSNELSQIARYLAIKSAVERYSADRPFIHADDVIWMGSRFHELTVGLLSWVEGFSRIVSIEYPAAVIASNGYPQYLEPRDWIDDYRAADKRYLFLPNHCPATTEAMRISYTVPWAWTPSTTIVSVTQAAHGFAVNDYVYLDATWQKALDMRLATHKVATIAAATPPAVSGSFTAAELSVPTPAEHFSAICYQAAAIACQALATKYTKGSDSTIGADSVQRISNASEFGKRAAEYEKLYQQGVGQGKDKAASVGSGVFVDLETSPGWPGTRQYIYHGRRTHGDTGRRP